MLKLMEAARVTNRKISLIVAFHHCRLLASFLIWIFAWVQHISAQDYYWWNQKHGWDGITHWSRYMILSPGYLGPNALPVPDMHTGVLFDKALFEAGSRYYFQAGEQTIDGNSRLYFPFANGKAALEISHTPIEYYKTDTMLRDERRARSRHVEGLATGDIGMNTYFALVNGPRFPDVVLRIGLRAPSGTRLYDARFSDAPGYFFDISFGKTLIVSGENNERITRAYGMLGFYAWQTNFDRNRQNDALLIGFGLKMTGKHSAFYAETAGYFGYMEMRDDPVVIRVGYDIKCDAGTVKIQYQKGVHDVYHHCIQLSVIRHFSLVSKLP